MDESELREMFRARMAERAAMPPLDAVQKFLSMHVSDSDGFDGIRADVRQTAQVTTWGLRLDLAALDAVLAEPQTSGTFLYLIEIDANWSLDDASDAAAEQLLRKLTEILRDVLAEFD